MADNSKNPVSEHDNIRQMNNRIRKKALEAIMDITLIAETIPEKQKEQIFTKDNIRDFIKAMLNDGDGKRFGFTITEEEIKMNLPEPVYFDNVLTYKNPCVRVKLSLAKPVKARRLVVSLIGEEWVYINCGSGKNRTRYEKNIRLHDESIELSGEVTYRAVEKDFQFRLPANAPQEIFVS